MDILLIDPSRTLTSAGTPTGPSIANRLLNAKPEKIVKIRYGTSKDGMSFTDEELKTLEEADFIVKKFADASGEAEFDSGHAPELSNPHAVVRVKGIVGDQETGRKATISVYKRYGRLAILHFD